MSFQKFIAASLLLHAIMYVLFSERKLVSLLVRKGEVLVEIERYADPKRTDTASFRGRAEERAKAVGMTDGSELGVLSPIYPTASRLRGEQGRVVVKILLSPKNTLISSEVETSSGYSALDMAALEAVRSGIKPETEFKEGEVRKIGFTFRLQ